MYTPHPIYPHPDNGKTPGRKTFLYVGSIHGFTTFYSYPAIYLRKLIPLKIPLFIISALMRGPIGQIQKQ